MVDGSSNTLMTRDESGSNRDIYDIYKESVKLHG
jgi:hypothetical protein